MNKITGIVIALNEASNIADCIHSLQKVCNEIIVVVDKKTDDDTAKISEHCGAKVFIQEYLGDGPQKAFAVPHATNDWVFSLDADERLEANAVDVINHLDLFDDRFDAYQFRRRNFVGQHWIKAAGFYPDSVTRFYNRKSAGYAAKKKHSSVVAKKVKSLNVHITHYTYRDYTHWIERINQLSSRDAWVMYEDGKRASRATPFTHAFVAILRKFIFKGGFLQGMDGVTVTATTAFHVYMKYMKLYELQQLKENK